MSRHPHVPSVQEGLPRGKLDPECATVLKDGKNGTAVVTRYDLDGDSVVLKEWNPSNRFLLWWAKSNQRRAIANYISLQGFPGIAKLRGCYADDAFLVDFIDGETLNRFLEPQRLRRGLDSLESAMKALHEVRFVHLDLHQKRNIIIDQSGGAWLVDLGQGFDCRRGIIRRIFFPLLAKIDGRALLKFRAKYAPETLDEKIRSRAIRLSKGPRLHRSLRPVWRGIRRWLARKEKVGDVESPPGPP